MQIVGEMLGRLRFDIQAVTALEYAMIAALIAVAAVTVISGLGGQLSTTLSSVSNAL